MTEVNINLAAVGGGGDAQPDTVIANATNGADVVLVIGDSLGVSVLGLAAQINVTGAEAANDRIVVNALAGDDVIEASGLQAGAVGLTLDGGAGDDVLIGGLGNDIIVGGPGDNIEIQGFVAGLATEDSIDLSGRGFSFEQVMAHATMVDGNTVLDFGTSGHITLVDVATESLHLDDFLLAA